VGPNVVPNFLDTLSEQLFVSQSFTKAIPSTYDPWP